MAAYISKWLSTPRNTTLSTKHVTSTLRSSFSTDNTTCTVTGVSKYRDNFSTRFSIYSRNAAVTSRFLPRTVNFIVLILSVLPINKYHIYIVLQKSLKSFLFFKRILV